MASRGRPRGTGQVPLIIDQPPTFDQRAFVEAVGVVVAAIAQASIAGSQGDPSNPRGLGRIVLRHSRGEEIRWWPTIGSCRSRKC